MPPRRLDTPQKGSTTPERGRGASRATPRAAPPISTRARQATRRLDVPRAPAAGTVQRAARDVADHQARDPGGRRSRHTGRTLTLVLAALVVLAGLFAGIVHRIDDPPLSPLRARIVSIAEGQIGYRTDPPDSYCNKFSAYWGMGTPTGCSPGLRSEEWCADFAAWVWQKAGALVVYHFTTGDLSSASYSFYQWGLAHGTWHAVGSGYTPQPGDVAVYGLDVTTQVAVHVAIVTGYSPGARGPDVVNGDGDRTGFSVVETGTDQFQADVHTTGGLLAGYVSPTSPRAAASPHAASGT